ncbi:MAG: TonB-dependent receptor [Burkholderiales bacterium]
MLKPFKLRPVAAAFAELNTTAWRKTPPKRPPTLRKLLPLGAMMLGGAALAQTPAPSASEITLPEVQVREQPERVRPNQGYQGNKTRIGKTEQNPLDIPQSMTIVPEALIRDRAQDSLVEALRNVPSITFNAAEGGRIGDNINIRGFSAVGDIYLDGMKDNGQYNREVFNLEQIDVLRGPASMLFGRGSTGGVINQVSKRAFLYNQYSASATVGSYNYRRETMDLNQKVGETTAIRLNAMKTDTDSFRNEVEFHRWGFAPSIRFGIGTSDELELSFYRLQYTNTPDYGIPVFNRQGGQPIPVPPSFFYGLPAADFQSDSADVATASYIHRFSSDTEVKTMLRQNTVSRDMWAVAPNIGNPATFNPNTPVNRGRQARGANENNTQAQVDFSTKQELFGMKNEILAGSDWLHEYGYRWNNVGDVANPPTTVYPNPYPSLPANYFTSRRRTANNMYDTDTIGVYVQDTLEFIENWKLLLGVRWDRFNADYQTLTARFGRTDYMWSYRAGVMYQPFTNQMYYVSYGTSFNPSADNYNLNISLVNTEPEKNINYEIGGKWELYDGKLTLTSAIFDTIKTNERNTDASTPTIALLSGKRHTAGVELGGAGRINPDWDVFAGFSRMWAKVDESNNPAFVGLTPQNTAPYTGNLWTTYRLPYGFRVGGGLEAQGKRYIYGPPANNLSPPPTIRNVPAYVKWDAMIGYEQKYYSLALNFINIFDKEYYPSAYQNGGFANPGTPRSVMFTASLKY